MVQWGLHSHKLESIDISDRMSQSSFCCLSSYGRSGNQNHRCFYFDISIVCLYAIFQVYNTTVSYFVNGVGIGSTARGTQSLAGKITDERGEILLGQTYLGKETVTSFYKSERAGMSKNPKYIKEITKLKRN